MISRSTSFSASSRRSLLPSRSASATRGCIFLYDAFRQESCSTDLRLFATGGRSSNWQQVEGALELAAGVRVAGARGHFDARFVHPARVIEAPQLLERLSAVEICGGVVRIGGDQFPEGRDRFLQFPGLAVLHCQTVTGETVFRVLREHRTQHFHAI